MLDSSAKLGIFSAETTLEATDSDPRPSNAHDFEFVLSTHAPFISDAILIVHNPTLVIRFIRTLQFIQIDDFIRWIPGLQFRIMRFLTTLFANCANK